MKTYIKHMVSHRCKMIIKSELKKLDLRYHSVELGVIDLINDITEVQKKQLKTALAKTGLELIEDRKSILVERIKTAVIDLVHHSTERPKEAFSVYLSDKLNRNYTYLSNVFSESEGYTIARFTIMHKIERVKELIQYGELTFSEIAYTMHYSSIAHLSNQFKKITGSTLTEYKMNESKRVRNLESL